MHCNRIKVFCKSMIVENKTPNFSHKSSRNQLITASIFWVSTITPSLEITWPNSQLKSTKTRTSKISHITFVSLEHPEQYKDGRHAPLTFWINKKFIYKCYHEWIKNWFEHTIHETHECWRPICQPKWHNYKLIGSITGPKWHLRHIQSPNLWLMVTRP